MTINMPMSRSIKILVGACICVSCGAGLVAYTASILTQKGTVLQEQMQLFADEQTHQQEYVNLVNLLAETEAERSRLRMYLLNGDNDTITFLSKMDHLASAIGVDLVTSRLEVSSEEGSMQDILEIAFDIEGEDSAVKKFLMVLETVPYHSYITNVNITRSVNAESSALVTKSLVTFAMSLHQE